MLSQVRLLRPLAAGTLLLAGLPLLLLRPAR